MKAKTMVMIGSGNVAEHLGRAWYNSGLAIVQVYSRNEQSGKKLAKAFKCKYTSVRNKLIEDATYYCVAVNDDAIPSLAKELKNLEGIVFQTSGAVSLKYWTNKNYGVLWPVASVSARKINWGKVPFVVEASNTKTLDSLRKLSHLLGAKSIQLSEEQRAKAHTAAVFTSNFRDHLLFLASEYLSEEKINPEVLSYLSEQVPVNMKSKDLSNALTGPAKRGDRNVISKQLNLLSDPGLKKIYKLMSQSIIEKHGKKL